MFFGMWLGCVGSEVGVDRERAALDCTEVYGGCVLRSWSLCWEGGAL